MSEIKGIIPPLPTSFNEEGELMPDKIRLNIEKLSRYDLSGFLILGSNGEMVMLSDKEKVAAYRAAREAIGKDKIMIAGTGGQSTRETVMLTKEAAKSGADAVLVLNPYYYKGLMTREALTEHYSAVADASPVPVLIYNMPANSGMDMDAGTILAIAEHPNITGVKDSGGNLVKMGQIAAGAKPGFSVLAGSAGFLLPALTIGACGGILALANIAPSQCIEIFDSFNRGDIETSRKIQHRMIPLNSAVTRQWGVPALKCAMDHAGLYGGPCRKPLLPMEEEPFNTLISMLEENRIKIS